MVFKIHEYDIIHLTPIDERMSEHAESDRNQSYRPDPTPIYVISQAKGQED